MLVGFLILIFFFYDFKKGKIKKDIFGNNYFGYYVGGGLYNGCYCR